MMYRLIRGGSELLTVWMLVGAPCPGNAQPPAEKPPAKPADQSDTSWVYTSTEHGFTLRLPSANWRPSKRKVLIAQFSCNPLGSPMLAGVFSVKKQTEAEYRDAVKGLNDLAAKETDYLVKPTVREGRNAADNPYAVATLCEKGTNGDQYIYVAKSYTWVKDLGITVEVMFEGQGKMRSKFFQSVEYAEFEKAAKSICRSVEKAK
jgi:hypothetical protein